MQEALDFPVGPAGTALRQLVASLESEDMTIDAPADHLCRFATFDGGPLEELVGFLRRWLQTFALTEIRSTSPFRVTSMIRRSDGKLWRLTCSVSEKLPHPPTQLVCAPVRPDHRTILWSEVVAKETPSEGLSVLPQTVTASFDKLLAETMEKEHLVGLAAIAVNNDKLVYSRCRGFADVRSEAPIAMNTVFRIGSLSKTMTAIALVRLQERGQFALDDPVGPYLKAYRIEKTDPSWPEVTFRHLLTHTSGVRKRAPVWWFDDTEPMPTMAELYRDPPLTVQTAPGTERLYNNHGFATVGQLVEDISGERFETYAIVNVFDPLGMHRTDYLANQRTRTGRATSYLFDAGELDPGYGIEVTIRPAGSVLASVEDMSRYLLALTGGDEFTKVISRESLSEMMSPQEGIRVGNGSQGLGFFLGDADGERRLAWHTGGWQEGQTAVMIVCPEACVGVAIFTNTLELDGAHKRHMSVANHIVGRLLEE